MPIAYQTLTQSSPHLPAPGFSEPVRAAQKCFRRLLLAMAHPGRVQSLQNVLNAAPKPLTPAIAAICLSLFDTETSVWLGETIDSPEVRQFLSFHCACPICSQPMEASYAILMVQEAVERMSQFHIGTPEYPERATTLLLQTPLITHEPNLTLSSPGTPLTYQVSLAGTSQKFWKKRDDVNAEFPTGIDMIFSDRENITYIPRTTQVYKNDKIG